jgi:succinate dehydrogenase/fumarate reductase cytochrome b subunit
MNIVIDRYKQNMNLWYANHHFDSVINLGHINDKFSIVHKIQQLQRGNIFTISMVTFDAKPKYYIHSIKQLNAFCAQHLRLIINLFIVILQLFCSINFTYHLILGIWICFKIFEFMNDHRVSVHCTASAISKT